MAIHWSYRSLPEFRNVARELREQVWKRCVERSRVKNWEWGVVIVAIAGASFLSDHLPGWLGVDELWLTAVASGVATMVPALIWSQLVLFRGRKFIADEMPGHCLGCGYHLCGIDAERCPECGTVIRRAGGSEDLTKG